jgi:hypothetical protein
VTLGLAGRQGDLLDDVIRFCDEMLPERSVYRLLHRERDRWNPDYAPRRIIRVLFPTVLCYVPGHGSTRCRRR